MNWQEWLTRAFFPVGISFTLVALVLVAYVIDPLIAIRGSYALLGLLGAAGVYYLGTDTGFSPDSGSVFPASKRSRLAGKASLVLAVLGVAVVGFTGNRIPVLLLVAPVGFGLVGGQLAWRSPPMWILFQVCVLFLAFTLSKFLGTGFYFGGGDILAHTSHARALLADGGVQSIPGPYQLFPGMHVVAGTLSLITGATTYQALSALGIVVYAVLVLPTVYLLSRLKFDRTVAVSVVALTASLDTAIYYTNYVFPQSLAIALGLLVIYLAYRSNTESGDGRRRLILSAVLLLMVIVFVHHVSFVVLLGLAAGLASVGTVQRYLPRRIPVGDSRPRLRTGTIFAGAVAAVGYWSLVAQRFIRILSWGIFGLLLSTLAIASTSVTGGTVTLGTTLPENTVANAVSSLASTAGIYYALLTVLFALGIVTVLRRPSRFESGLDVVVVGTLGAVLVFKSPLKVAALDRLRHPLSLVTVVVLGIGLVRILGERRRTALAVVVLAGFATTGGLMAADDVRFPDEGVGTQNSFSQAEYEQLGAASAKTLDKRVGTLWLGSQTINHFGGNVLVRATVSKAGIRIPEGYFLYREAWPEHTVKYRIVGGRLGNLRLSERWLTESVRSSVKVYDAGQVGMVYAGDGELLAPGWNETSAGGR